MSDPVPPGTVTAFDVLAPRHDATIGAVRDWLGRRDRHDGDDPLLRLSRPTRLEVVRQMAGDINLELGGIDIGGLLVGGWSSYRELIQAGEETAADPHARRILEMASHTMEWTCRLSVHVAVDRVEVDHLDADIDVRLTLQALVAVVAGGRLMSVGSGTCDATVSLTVGPWKLTSAPLTLDLERVTTIALGSGIALTTTRRPSGPAAGAPR